jgi:hypothetical protein
LRNDRLGTLATVAVASKYLAIYLNDHLGGSTVGVELVRRAAGEYRGSELGDFLTQLAVEIEEDRETLRELMDELGVVEDKVKIAVGWVGEKAGRLKLNGHFLSRSPLSPVVELEALSLGIEGKRLMWVALREAAPVLELDPERFAALEARAARQREGLEPHREAAALGAVTPG